MMNPSMLCCYTSCDTYIKALWSSMPHCICGTSIVWLGSFVLGPFVRYKQIKTSFRGKEQLTMKSKNSEGMISSYSQNL